jgi:hypothetical protein
VKGVTHRRPCVLRPTSTPRLWRHRWMSVVTSNSQDQRADWRCGVGGVRRQDHHPHPCFSFIVSSSCVIIDVLRAFQREIPRSARALSLHAVCSVRLPHSSFFIRWAAVFCRTDSLQRGTDSSSRAQLHSLCLSRRSVRCACSAFARASVASEASVDGLSVTHGILQHVRSSPSPSHM